MKRLVIETPRQSQRVLEGLYRDMERRIASSPLGLCPVDMALNFLRLCHAQTCGKCVPCRIGLTQLSNMIREVLDANGLSADDIDWFILHQANRRIVESVAKRLKTDIERFPMNLQEYGNTSSASIPILLNEMNRKGLLKKGQKLVMAGFGAGLSWGAAVLEWGI